jgi:hypothetical protein
MSPTCIILKELKDFGIANNVQMSTEWEKINQRTSPDLKTAPKVEVMSTDESPKVRGPTMGQHSSLPSMHETNY